MNSQGEKYVLDVATTFSASCGSKKSPERASLVAQMVKNSPAMQETWV